MRRIGLIGGMSWESTLVYYRRLNERTRSLIGGLASADIILRSVNFEEIVALQKANQWAEAGNVLARIALDLERAGAEVIVICTNTMHILADMIQAAVSVPVLHVADVTAAKVRDAGCIRPLLLATRYTMEHDFYRGRVADRFHLEVLVPEEADRALVHNVIFDELCCGIVRQESREAYLATIERGKQAGADSVIFGCTEIGLLLGQEHVDLPVFDSTMLHADAALDFALAPRLEVA